MTENFIANSVCAIRQSFDAIPVIDVSPLVGAGDVQGMAHEIRWALSNVGFFYVKNHGIAPGLVDNCFEAARAFFDLTLPSKLALSVRNSGPAMRGYTELFGENTDPENTRDFKECFDIGPDAPLPNQPFFGPNQWPSGLSGFHETVYEYHEEMKRLALLLLRGIAISLDLTPSFFEAMMRNPISIQRLLRYPPQTGSIDGTTLGIGAHTDYGNLTILAQDNVGGLQVMNRDGIWVEGPPIPGTFVINIGDLVQRLSNDVYLANLHRVVNTSGRERYSIPFFIDADEDATFEPVATCVSDTNPARYAPVQCGEHKWKRFAASFAHLAPAA